MLDSNRPDTRLDLFVTEPFDFDQKFKSSKLEDVGGMETRILNIDTLIAMKRATGRDQDLVDADQLRKLIENRKK